jgi:hypothetical protein
MPKDAAMCMAIMLPGIFSCTRCSTRKQSCLWSAPTNTPGAVVSCCCTTWLKQLPELQQIRRELQSVYYSLVNTEAASVAQPGFALLM